jgi:hypothetical protein
MINTKIPTLALRKYQAIHVTAGTEAAKEGIPWWCAFGYAASAVGTSDAIELFAASQDWLLGWSQQAAKSKGELPVPGLVDEILDQSTD